MSEWPTPATPCQGTRWVSTTLHVTADGSQTTIAVSDASDPSEFVGIPGSDVAHLIGTENTSNPYR
jgi:hypothetical protein